MLRKVIPLTILILSLGYYGFSRLPYSQEHTSPPTSTNNNRVGDTNQKPEGIPGLTTPDGFVISYLAKNVVGARSMTKNTDGTIIYVGTRDSSIYGVVDQNKDGISEKIVTISSSLDTPNGVAYKDGDLYVAEVSRIIRFKDIDNNFDQNPSYEVIYDQCNVCEDRGIYSRIITLNVVSKEIKTFATGIRNTVGFDWSPIDNTLYFTDNGRDLLGDNTPPDELNHAPSSGLDFGFPRCHGNNVLDPQFSTADSCQTHTKPVVELGPHVAALGMKFYRGDMFPTEYKNQILIAEHGSWNRRDPIGYKVSLVNPHKRSYTDLVAGWLVAGEAWGRPVDILELPDGSVLISDDLNNAIYRLAYYP